MKVFMGVLGEGLVHTGFQRLLGGAAPDLDATLSAQADDTRSPFKFLVGQGLTYGSDSLIKVPFTVAWEGRQ